ncbi:portal protein [Ferrovibrio terrae]|uniref:portal protein n=1 Tax=Ferrovibrio terrae TaxID=2594003 RepID=UPI0031379696
MAKAAWRSRYEHAKKDADLWLQQIKDGHYYALPAHYVAHQAEGSKQPDNAKVFDATAVDAVSRRQADLHQKLFPAFRTWTDFSAPGAENNPAAKAALKAVREKFHAAIMRSNFHLEVHAALGDALVSIGCLAIHKGTINNPLRFEVIPSAELVVAEGPEGMLDDTWRRHKTSVERLNHMWPGIDLPQRWKDLLDKSPAEKVDVIEACTRNLQTGRWEICVHAGDESGGQEDQPLYKAEAGTNPRPAFRVTKAPGTSMGFGPVLRALPNIKTANKVVELVLKNAAIAVTGIWQADDDGVLNPANVKLVPGAIIPKAVGSNGLTPLKSPGQFDVSQLVLSELRQKIELTIEGPLPPDNSPSSRRTRYEVMVDEQRHAKVETPMALQLMTEAHEPIVKRCVEILADPTMAGSDFFLGEVKAGDAELEVWPVSPMVRQQDEEDADRTLSALANGQALFPNENAVLVKGMQVLRGYYDFKGVPGEFIRTEDELKAEQARQDEAQRSAQATAVMAPAVVEAGKAAGKAAGERIVGGGGQV